MGPARPRCLTASRAFTRRTAERSVFEGQNILDNSADRIAGIGIARTFQNLALFRTMSVFDNVRVGGHSQSRSDFFSDSVRLPWVRREESALAAEAWDIIDYLQLREVAHRCVADLPFGTQKRVELARALAARPKLLLLDEPAGGLNHHEVEELGRAVPPCPRRTPRNAAAGRASHGSGDVDLRSGGRAGFRPQDRGRPPADVQKIPMSFGPISDRPHNDQPLAHRARIKRVLRRNPGAAWPRFRGRRRRHHGFARRQWRGQNLYACGPCRG